MLSQKPKADQTVAGAAATSSSDPAPATTQVTQEQVMALLDSIQVSPEFTPDFSEFLTSPSIYGDSPADEFLTTPQDPRSNLDEDVATSPMLFQGGFDSVFESNIFTGFDDPLFDDKKSGEPALTLDMFGMPPTPATPALQWSSFNPSPSAQSTSIASSSSSASSSSTPAPRRRSTAATGTRKNITPASLVPVDAPTQTRKYVTPSATSRKELPAVFARKRSRSQALYDDEQDEADDLVTLPPNPTEQQLIEAKRRQNTVAARRSRKRKLEHQRALEDENEQLRTEVDELRAKARTYEALLRSHGITFES